MLDFICLNIFRNLLFLFTPAQPDMQLQESIAYRKGCRSMEEERYGDATEHFSEAVRLVPTKEGYAQLVSCYLAVGDITGAESAAHKGLCLQCCPMDPDIVKEYAKLDRYFKLMLMDLLAKRHHANI